MTRRASPRRAPRRSAFRRGAASVAVLTGVLGLGAGVSVEVPAPALTLHRAPAVSPGVSAALRRLPSGVRTGLLAFDLTSGGPLDSVSPDTPLIPASVTKLVTAAAVLADRGGAGGWWSTELTVPAAQVGRASVDTVTLRGSGDPTLEATRGPYSLRALATQAYAHGLRRVQHVRLADHALAAGAWAGEPIGVPMTALRLAGWHDRPPATAAQARRDLGAVLIAELRRAGVTVASEDVGSVAVTSPSALAPRKDAAGKVLAPDVLVPVASRSEQGVASVRSASPAVVLAATLRPSDNLRAEELLATLARRPAAPGRREDALSRERAVLRRAHVDLGGVVLHDGSGLDRRDRLTPRALVSLLRTQYDLPYPVPGTAGLPPALYAARHNAFAELLPQAGTGESVPAHDGRGGTLAGRLVRSGLDVRAKTGTLPGVSALAGYVTARSGHVVAFAVIMNGPESTPILTLRAVQDDLVRALAAAH